MFVEFRGVLLQSAKIIYNQLLPSNSLIFTLLMVNFQQLLKDTFVKPFVDTRAFFAFGKREFGLVFLLMIAEIYLMQGFRNYAFDEGITLFSFK